jgi:hypothetical protein
LADSRAALRFGDYAAHKPLAYRYLHEAQGLPWTEDSQIALMEDLFTSNPCQTEGYRNFANAVKVICAYNRDKTANQPYRIKRHPQTLVPMVEMAFACLLKDKIRGFSISYCGRIDLVVEETNGLFVVDHKTTSMLGPQFWDSIAVDAQPRGYCWALKECIGEEPIGYIINAIGVRESVDSVLFDRASGEMLLPPKSKAKPIEFARQRFYTKTPQGQLDEWYRNLLSQIDVFLYYYTKSYGLRVQASDDFPTHRRHCIQKYGKCQFYDVCSLPEPQRETALTSNAFRDVEWSPLEQNKETIQTTNQTK